MIFEESYHIKKNNLWNLNIEPVRALQSNRGYFATPYRAILPPLQIGRQSLFFGPIWKRTRPLDSLTPKNYINIYITGLRNLF